MKRRDFLTGTAGLLLIGACGDDDGPSADADAGLTSFTVENVDSSGHVHALTVFCIDLTGQAPVTYQTGFGDTHTHLVMLTADEVVRIAGGETVTITFTDGHEHSYMIAKPAGECD